MSSVPRVGDATLRGEPYSKCFITYVVTSGKSQAWEGPGAAQGPHDGWEDVLQEGNPPSDSVAPLVALVSPRWGHRNALGHTDARLRCRRGRSV